MGNKADPALHLAIELVSRALAMLGAVGAGTAAYPRLHQSLDLLEAERKAQDDNVPARAEDERDVTPSGAGPQSKPGGAGAASDG